MKDDRLYLIHIAECLARIDEYTAAGRKAFLESTLIQDAVLRNLQTLTEPTQRLSEALKGRHPEVDWRGMAGFRNVIVHNYLAIDVPRVWRVIERDLPELKARLRPLLEEVAPPATAKRNVRKTKRTTENAGRPKRPRKRKP